MARISSNYLSLFLVRALISGNYAERWVDKNTSERRPFLLFISSQTEAEISINGLQYENNKASGIYIQVSPFVFDNSSSVLITNTHFENNELFSIFVMAIGWSLVQMKNIRFRGNSLQICNRPLFHFYSLSQGTNVTIEDAIFEKNASPEVMVLFQFPRDNVDDEVCNWYDYKNEVRLTNVLFRENKVLSFSTKWLECFQQMSIC